MHKAAQRGVAKIDRLQPSSRLERLSWDDLRIFLACSEASSFRSAATTLGLTASTVTRRIERLEFVVDAQLFHRLPDGGILTPEGRVLAESAKAMHQSLCTIERQRSARYIGLRDEVTIAVTEGLGSFWLMPHLVEFQRNNPLSVINLMCAMESVDVLRLEADLAIQFTMPSKSDLIALKLAKLHIFPFAAQEYLDIYGVPQTYADMVNHRLVEQVAPQLDSSALGQYFRLSDTERVVALRTNTSTAHLYAIERGAGIGGLPSFALALGAAVVPVDIGDGYAVDIWLTYHPDTRRSPHKAKVIEWIKNIFDPKIYPWFGNKFVHPKELVELKPRQAHRNDGSGFLAVNPMRWRGQTR